MVKDRLITKVLVRFHELGLPLSLMKLDEFRNDFFLHRWVLLVRDGVKVTRIDLFHPEQGKPSLRRR